MIHDATTVIFWSRKEVDCPSSCLVLDLLVSCNTHFKCVFWLPWEFKFDIKN